jgi:CRP/FNR family transcriptional regulator
MIGVMSDPVSDGGAAVPSFDQAVAHVAFLRALSPRDRDRLRPYATVRRVPKGGLVWALDETAQEFIFAIDGHVKLMRPSENGREVIIDVGKPGELLCASAACAFAPYCCTCTALDRDVTVLVLPRRDVLHVLEQNPAAAAAFVREATGRDIRLGQRIVELASGQVEQRVSALLLRLADQAGTAVAGGQIRIALKLSRQDLADLCGTTLESAIRVMTRLSREGIVRTTASGFVIRDRRRLESLTRGRSAR